MIVYDYDLIEKVNITIEEGHKNFGYENIFFKCIHFFENWVFLDILVKIQIL